MTVLDYIKAEKYQGECIGVVQVAYDEYGTIQKELAWNYAFTALVEHCGKKGAYRQADDFERIMQFVQANT